MLRSPHPTDAPALVGTHWRITALKYDQRLHYSLPATLVSDDGDLIVLHAAANTQVRHYTRSSQKGLRWDADFYFWRSQSYNVYVNRNPDGSINHFYCNVGLLPRVTPLDSDDLFNSHRTITFVDMDIDVRIWPDGRYRLLDLDEFRAHSVAFGYSPKEQYAAYLTMLDILIRWRNRQMPFDRA